MAIRYRTAALITSGAIALVLVTSATTAYAAKTLITGSDIARGTITGANIATGTIDSTDIKNKSITATDLAPGAISLSHLDKKSIKAGHVHTGTGVPKINPRTSTAPLTPASAGITPASTSAGVLLQNGQFTSVASIGSLPAGTYVVQASGTIGGQALSNGSTTFYETDVSCRLYSGVNSFAWVDFSPGVYSQHSAWLSTIAMTKVITTTAASSLSIQCYEYNSHGNPSGFAQADLVAFPVTSVSAG